MNTISHDIALWLQDLRREIPEICDIWIIGSRANGTERTDSDWDFLVNGNGEMLVAIQSQPKLHRLDVDLLVSLDGENFQSAWGPEKTITLSKLKWTLINSKTATYQGTKWIPSTDLDDIEAPYDLSTLGNQVITNCVGYKLTLHDLLLG